MDASGTAMPVKLQFLHVLAYVLTCVFKLKLQGIEGVWQACADAERDRRGGL